ncbi:hypothetical protein AAHE18_17G088400 [Arachis hypogaea]
MVSSSLCYLLLIPLLVGSIMVVAYAAKLDQEFDVTWGHGHPKMLNNGELLTLSLDKISDSGFQSKTCSLRLLKLCWHCNCLLCKFLSLLIL